MTRDTANPEALWDERLNASPDPTELLGEQGWLRPWTTRLGARALEAALPAPLGAAPPARHRRGPGHCRQGQGKTTRHTATAQGAMAGPREREGRCAPPLGPQRPRRRAGVDATVRAR